MPLNDAADIGQTNASAFEIRRGVQALKNPEELVRILHVEPDAIVADEKDGLLCS